jgi:hypothetical protein
MIQYAGQGLGGTVQGDQVVQDGGVYCVGISRRIGTRRQRMDHVRGEVS